MKIPDFMPEHIKHKYVEIKSELIKGGILNEIDYPAFDMAMFHYGLAVEAMKILKEKGLFQKDRSTLRKNPALQIFRENSNAFQKYATRLGFFPMERELMINDINFYKEHTSQVKYVK
jgi:P27 family predicted phage terminase small subunit